MICDQTRRARVRISKSDSLRPKGGFAPIQASETSRRANQRFAVRGWFFSGFHTTEPPSRIVLSSPPRRIHSALGDQIGGRGLREKIAVDTAASDLRLGEDDASSFPDDLCDGEDLVVFCSAYELCRFRDRRGP